MVTTECCLAKNKSNVHNHETDAIAFGLTWITRCIPLREGEIYLLMPIYGHGHCKPVHKVESSIYMAFTHN